MQQRREVSEIVRRNVKQVIQTLMGKGLSYEQVLLSQYLNGQKSQYQFLLPKSRHHSYYKQELSTCMEVQRQRKVPYSDMAKSKPSQKVSKVSQMQTKTITVVGKVEQISVGAMYELIKELRQNKEPYEPYDNQVYEQQLTLNIKDQEISRKVSQIISMINAIKNPTKTKKKHIQSSNPNTKMDFLRNQSGTQKDGSMGSWGGKKYQGLGMRDQFTNYRKQVSKNFYQSIPR